jgi:hypothetical protein
VTGGKPIAVLLQSISVTAINPLVAFYDIHGGKREVLFFFFIIFQGILGIELRSTIQLDNVSCTKIHIVRHHRISTQAYAIEQQ